MKGEQCADCPELIGAKTYCRPATDDESGIWTNICASCHVANHCITPGYCARYLKMPEEIKTALRQGEAPPLKIAA